MRRSPRVQKRASVPGQPAVEGVIALCESLCRADRVE